MAIGQCQHDQTLPLRLIPCDVLGSWAVRGVAGNAIFGTSPLIYTHIIDVHFGGESEVFEVWKLETICNRQIENNVLKERRDQKSGEMFEDLHIPWVPPKLVFAQLLRQYLGQLWRM